MAEIGDRPKPRGAAHLLAIPDERDRTAASERREALLAITSALAEAITPDEVFEAVIDRTAVALGASVASLWMVGEDRKTVRIVRQRGLPVPVAASFEVVSLDGSEPTPALDVIKHGDPIWIRSQQALLHAYPHLAPYTTPGGRYRIAYMPLTNLEQVIGALGLTIEEEGEVAEDERGFLLLVARYVTQALERLRLLDAERRSRERADAFAQRMMILSLAASRLHEETEQARSRAEHLYRFAHAAVVSERLDQVLDAALEAITTVLCAERAAVLLLDDAGAMRFHAWRGLSDAYRAAVDGHSPWPPDARAPEPVLVPDCLRDPAWAAYAHVFRAEGIGSLAFIPLVKRDELVGKFMVYYRDAHAFSETEVHVARTVANHLASIVARFRAVADLERTLRDNELFAGVLAHDLRNPITAITTASHAMLTRRDGETHQKAVRRVLASTERMTRMIDQLLDFTRIRIGGGIAVSRCTASLADLARQAIAELELVYPERRFECVVHGDSLGEWDPDLLLQVASNLITNASQHGVGDSAICVTVDGLEPGAVALSVHNAGAIPAALLPALFDPFRGRERHRGERGLGLGLYIVRELVRAHGGSVGVASTDATGTTFTVRLPRR